MIYRDGKNPRIEKWKQEFHLKGDVYVINHFIESLESHRKLFPESRAATIEEAEHERIVFMKEEAERIANLPHIEEPEPEPEPKKKGKKKKEEPVEEPVVEEPLEEQKE